MLTLIQTGSAKSTFKQFQMPILITFLITVLFIAVSFSHSKYFRCNIFLFVLSVISDIFLFHYLSTNYRISANIQREFIFAFALLIFSLLNSTLSLYKIVKFYQSNKDSQLFTSKKLKRYKKKHPIFRIYVLITFLLPVVAYVTKYNSTAILSVLFLSGVALLATSWNPMIDIFQCYSEHDNGTYVVYQDQICELKPVIYNEKDESCFYYQNQCYILDNGIPLLIKPREEFLISELQKDMVDPNYNLYAKNDIIIPKINPLDGIQEGFSSPIILYEFLVLICSFIYKPLKDSLFLICLFLGSKVKLIDSISKFFSPNRFAYPKCSVFRTSKGEALLIRI